MGTFGRMDAALAELASISPSQMIQVLRREFVPGSGTPGVHPMRNYAPQHAADAREAAQLCRDLRSVVARCGALHKVSAAGFMVACWSLASREILTLGTPWAVHEFLYRACFSAWEEDSMGPPPVWTPAPGSSPQTNIGLLLRNYGAQLFPTTWNSSEDPAHFFTALQRLSYDKPEVYWPLLIKELGIVFGVPAPTVAEFCDTGTNPGCTTKGNGAAGAEAKAEAEAEQPEANPGGTWFPGAQLNIAVSCLVPTEDGKRSDDRAAIVWRNQGADCVLHRMSLRELRDMAMTVAAGLTLLGLGQGAAIAVCLPMSPHSVAAYLGIILAGGTVVSIADSFAAPELAVRLKIASAQAIITQDVILRGPKALPLFSRVVDAKAPRAIVLSASPDRSNTAPTNLRKGDIWFSDLLQMGSNRMQQFSPPALPSDHICNILFSSGTTGTPKAIPWTHVGPIKAAADAFMHQDVKPGDTVAWPTSLGWMMGPWLIFGALINGASMALYNGSPLGPGFLKFVQDARVSVLGVIPTMVRAWRTLHAAQPWDYNWSSIRVLSSTGEASTPMDYLWLMSRAGYRAPVIEYCGGTEIGGAFVTGSLLQPQALSCFSTPTMGARLVLLDAHGRPRREGEVGTGECAVMPRMLGASSNLLNADHFAVYFRGMPRVDGQILRRHGDAFELTPGGFFRAHGRMDDTMNVGGIKVSSVEIERVCNVAHPAVQETAAVSVSPASEGPEELVVCAVPRPNSVCPDPKQLRAAFSGAIQRELNPLFKVSRVVVMSALPRTATNKVMRRELRSGLMESQKAASATGRARL